MILPLWLRKDREDELKNELAYAHSKMTLARYRVGNILELVKQLRENTWDKDLADTIIEDLHEVERIVDDNQVISL